MAQGPQQVVANSNAEAHRQRQLKATRDRQRQELELQKEFILSQRTSNPGRRAALTAALAQIEAQIAKLD